MEYAGGLNWDLIPQTDFQYVNTSCNKTYYARFERTPDKKLRRKMIEALIFTSHQRHCRKNKK